MNVNRIGETHLNADVGILGSLGGIGKGVEVDELKGRGRAGRNQALRFWSRGQNLIERKMRSLSRDDLA